MITASKILDTIHTRTYYLAERKKKEDPSISFSQTSDDNKDVLMEFLQSAINEIKGKMVKKTLSFSLDIENGTFEVNSKREKSELIKPLLEKGIEDYISEFVLFSWLKDTAPEIADGNTYLDKLNEVEKYISMLSPIPRRRSTDLAGI